MAKLKTVNIKGKEYVEVPTRIKEFHRQYPNGKIESTYERIPLEGDALWIVSASVTPDVATPERMFNGHAQEVESQGYINKTSALENAETSAWGRALGALNIGLIDTIASADEVYKATNRTQSTYQAPAISKDSWFVNVAYGHNEDIKKIAGRQFVADKKMWAVPATEETRQALFIMNSRKGIKDVFDINGEKVSVQMSPEAEKELTADAFAKDF